MFNHNSETKGHGSIRKNKVYGTIGVIALGAIAMFSNNKTASADEVSSSEPTTTTPVASAADTSLAVQSQAASAEAAAPATATDSTAPTANATAPVEAASPAAPAAESTPTALASSASDTTPVTYTAPAAAPAAPAAPAKATETEPVKVDSTDLDNAVEDAKKAGVEVTREADVDRGTATTPQETEQKIAEIKNDYKKQTEEIKSVTEAAKVDTAKYNEAKTQYDTAKAEYDVKKSEYDTAKAKYDYDLAQYHVLKTQYDTAKAQYDRDLATYNEAKLAYAAAKTQYDVDKEAYDKAKTTYDTDKAAYDIAKAQYDAAKISYDAAKVKYEKDLEKYKEDRVAYNIAKTAYDEAQNKYVEDLAQYNKDKAAYDTAKEAYDTAKATYDTAKTQYDSDLAKYKVDKAAYDVAKTTYDRELAQYQVYKEQYDTAKTQYDRDLGQYQILKAQYDAAKTQYAIDKAAYDQAKAQYTVDKAAYDKAKAQYDAALAKYKADSEQYKRDMEEYTRAMIEAEAKKHQDGYLTEAKSQSLIFKSEPNAIRSIDPSVRQYTKKELDDLVRSWGISPTNPDKTKSTAYSYFNQINSNNAYARLVLEKNKPVDVTYTGLENSSFNGKKISKVVYTYTLKATEFGDGTKMSMYASDDPTVTAWYNDFFTSTNINVKVKFYGEDGELIDPTGSLVSFSSLNRGNGSGAVYKDAIESVRYFNGKLIPISGSSIKIQANNSAYADSSNAEKALGSRWETLEWDTAESDKKWYGAIVGEVTQPEISFNMVSYKSGNVWFAFNSDIKAIGVPIKPVEPVEPKAPTAPVEPKAPTAPVEPKAPTAPVEPKAPTPPTTPAIRTAKYHYNTLKSTIEYGNVVVDYQDKQGNTISPRIVDTPDVRVGTAYDTTDHKTTTITTADGTIYRIDTSATQGNESGQVVKGTTRVVYVYDKVEKPVEKKYGDVTVEYKNKDGVTIAPKVTDTPRSEVGTDYDTTDQRKDTITTVDGKKYKLDLTATQGAEIGKVVEGNTTIIYYYDLVPEKKYGDVTVEYK
ncbi:GbpC/Spa domain-containing protein, partial [Streptococcus sinensis]|uniref:GbpC/Spa domain-containing protein n=1 Tax=Streptococcus sinensis TaxID=176090 RepID=UPI001AE0621A